MTRCPACGASYPADAKFCPKDGTRLLGATATPPVAGAAIPAPGAVDRATAVSARPDRPASVTPWLEPGQRLDGRYEIERKLGEGGMSFVYLARDIATGERYAIKVLTSSLSSDEKAMARLRREASFGMRLAHPNVCHILRTGETETGLVYVVMPYIKGEILSDRTIARGQLPMDEVLRHVRDIAAGLQVAHELKIVHRDLKPENVMVCQQPDGTEYAVVMDFGLAKERRADAELQKLTATGIILGTPEFMSPEQIRGKPLDARSDVYALALMAYEMLTGKLPFAGASGQEIMIARLRGEPLPIRRARPDLDIPEGVERVIAKALDRNPDDRFQNAPAFAEALAAGAKSPVQGSGEGWLGKWFS
jgi:serine/threonine protein kinase